MELTLTSSQSGLVQSNISCPGAVHVGATMDCKKLCPVGEMNYLSHSL